MPAQLLDGNAVAQKLLAATREEFAGLDRPPRLVAIRANDDAGSRWYARAQAQHCAANNLEYTLDELGATATREQILAAIVRHNQDETVAAILLHLPLPPRSDYLELVAAIDPRKDAEGAHPVNLGKLLAVGKNGAKDLLVPCTAASAVRLAQEAGAWAGKKAVVVGRSAIVGKPAALLLLGLNATVTVAHSYSDVAAECRAADLIIAATGASGAAWNRYRAKLAQWRNGGGEKPLPPDLSPLIKKEMVKEGATVIDVGVNQIPRALDDHGEPVKNAKGKPEMLYAGDVDFAAVKEIAGYITPPQGGVGPLTNAFLIRNTVAAAFHRRRV
ncbi:MAG: bifunctional 5,10-methylenetetrahydrofolate dehydrogenase/5,10-methenyltetrahydrofolate cyclohydrolase [Planctomycetota bacterium]|jgi:methylenetetrahydrofolate dehydrogenase (NADP+)/methenyltetrahydrofolate cyclohydrolase|nr:bifunctional 5,10-methylenetetrahydrofolate dehydrogenase/5,10-methenyltetrahydrofolate cyclohydrolase [Planctomycetota bacterium]